METRLRDFVGRGYLGSLFEFGDVHVKGDATVRGPPCRYFL